VKVLSLRQPWVHVVLHFGKTIENRRWRPVDLALLEELQRGFLIHAAKGMPRAYFNEAASFIADVLGAVQFAEFMRDFEARAQFGGIVGRARLVEIISPWAENAPLVERVYPPDVNPKWHARGQYGLVLADVATVPFVPCKGRLSFFNFFEGAP
jgi:hypothetical protein